LKKRRIPKINTVFYAGKWIGLAVLTGVVLPGVIWLLSGRFFWPFCIIGGVLMLSFLIVFMIEMNQDFGAVPYYQKHLKEDIPFDRENQYAVIRSSICTGEKVAGFRDKRDGHFTEVMLISTKEDEIAFKNTYDLNDIKKEY